MKVLETSKKTAPSPRPARAAAPAVASVPGSDQEGYSEDARKAEINARGRRRWLGPRRKGWLR